MSKQKILLTTLQSVNIGNRLQNYALQNVICDMGYEVYTPVYDTPEYNTYKKKLKLYIKLCLAHLGVKKYKFLLHEYQRKRRFWNFNRTYISNLFKVSFDRVNTVDWSKFDYAVTGSDQVWHRWSDNQNELNFFYLQFMPNEKRISYAPSFGFEEFPAVDKHIHFEGIKGMSQLSARENSGKSLMEALVGKTVDLVLDPTLLLDALNWNTFAKRPKYDCEENKYILVYMLGEKPKEYISYIDQVAKVYNLQIVDVLNEANMDHYMTTPDEFVWLVEHAKYILTDSFHACVFSIIFHKTFLVFRRQGIGYEKMFGRIETLFSTFGITGHIYENSNTKLSSDVDWEIVDSNIKSKQVLSKQYLERVLDKNIT